MDWENPSNALLLQNQPSALSAKEKNNCLKTCPQFWPMQGPHVEKLLPRPPAMASSDHMMAAKELLAVL